MKFMERLKRLWDAMTLGERISEASWDTRSLLEPPEWNPKEEPYHEKTQNHDNGAGRHSRRHAQNRLRLR